MKELYLSLILLIVLFFFGCKKDEPEKLEQSPSCLTQEAANVSETGATLNGTVNANNLSTTVTFEYRTTSSYGSTATVSQSPVTGNTNTNVSADISGLTSGTTYHFRVKAENSCGLVYGSIMSIPGPTPRL
jgi:hypothetical protein